MFSSVSPSEQRKNWPSLARWNRHTRSTLAKTEVWRATQTHGPTLSARVSRVPTLLVGRPSCLLNECRCQNWVKLCAIFYSLLLYRLLGGPSNLSLEHLKVCSQHTNWTELQFWTNAFQWKRSQRLNWLSTNCPSFAAANQVVTHWRWRTWPTNASRNWVNMFQVSIVQFSSCTVNKTFYFYVDVQSHASASLCALVKIVIS